MTESKPVAQGKQSGVSRREFLYYIWSASAALLFVESGAGIVWFWGARMHPRSDTLVDLDLKELPAVSEVFYVPGRFWLASTQAGLIVWRNLCTHLGCTLNASEQGTQLHPFPHFFCPCHGAEFTYDGYCIVGPATRALDRFRVIVYAPDETRQTDDGGSAVNVDGAVRIQVDTEVVIFGAPRLSSE